MAQEIADSTLLDTWGSSGAKIEPDISKIIEGWQFGEQPPHEYMNWLQNTFGSKLNHILKNGVAEWNDETEYLAGSSVQHNGNVWLCKAANTNSEPTDANANWDKIPSLEKLALTVDTINDFPLGATTGDTCIVKDLDRGGIFIYDSTRVAENNQGTNFNGWIRQYSGAVNVKWFGAKGDGVTDDTLAIKKLLLLAGNIELEKNKVYLVREQLKLKSNTDFNLNGSKILRGFNTSPTGAGLMGLISSNQEQIKIYNGTLDCNGTNYNLNSANILGGDGIKNLTIDNVIFLDVVHYHAIDFSNIENMTINNCKFLGQYQEGATAFDKEAIQLDPGYSSINGYSVSKNIKITNCVFDENVDSGTPSYYVGIGNHSVNRPEVITDDIKIKGCTFRGHSLCGVRTYAWENTLIANNIFENCLSGIRMSQGTGTSIIGNKNITIENNTFNSFGNSIIMENTNSNKNINVTINNNVFEDVVDAVVLSNTRELKITNNTINASSNAVRADGASINNNILIASNSITNCVDGAIAFAGTPVDGVTVSSNTFTDIKGRCFHSTGTYAENRRNIVISNNLCVDIARTVFALDSGATSKVSITGNTISTGELNVIPSDPLIINLGVAGLSNYMSNNNISDDIMKTAGKTWRATNGGIATGEKCYGTPEGVIIAGIGSTVTRIDGGANSTLYVKESGTGNTGWVAK